MKVEFIEPALLELDDAINFYNIQSDGLGKKFLDEVTLNIRYISRYPKAWPKFTKHTHKTTLRKFPYSLIFSIGKNTIYILAVAHHHREPDYWINRIL
jgi:mRNA-degrading endonuclease RelE of RelBE toxin-antitoxin system